LSVEFVIVTAAGDGSECHNMITESDISLALPSDAVAIAALSRRTIEQGLDWRWTPHRVMNSMAEADTNVVVARLGSDMLGFAIMSYGDEEAHMQLFATQPRCRRQGVGSALLAWLEATARVAGIGKIHLEARSDNAGARAFYRHHGFELAGRRDGYYQGVEDAVRMVKKLA
jgi:ribosomal-protein-alanine acetyltransferase